MSPQQSKQQFQLGDYVDVAERIVEFREKYPEGSLQPADLAEPFKVLTVGSDTFIVVVAAAYRTPDDRRPGIGMAYETYPGRTPYTRGSELQNAETSAWGRAIVATLAADTKRGIASAQEVKGRSTYEMTAVDLGKQAVAAKGKRDALLNLHEKARQAGKLGDLATNERGDTELLGELIVRLGKEAAPAKRRMQRAPIETPEPSPAEPVNGNAWPEVAHADGDS